MRVEGELTIHHPFITTRIVVPSSTTDSATEIFPGTNLPNRLTRPHHSPVTSSASYKAVSTALRPHDYIFCPVFFQSARNFSSPASVSGWLSSLVMTS